MNYNNFFRRIEKYYRIEINKELRNTLTEHFGADLDIYNEQDLYERVRSTYKQMTKIYKSK